MAETKFTKITETNDEQNKVDSIRQTLSNRFDQMLKEFDNTTNIAKRYDLKIALNELQTIYQLLFYNNK